MKKQSKKLTLDRQTIRTISAHASTLVVGGMFTTQPPLTPGTCYIYVCKL